MEPVLLWDCVLGWNMDVIMIKYLHINLILIYIYILIIIYIYMIYWFVTHCTPSFQELKVVIFRPNHILQRPFSGSILFHHIRFRGGGVCWESMRIMDSHILSISALSWQVESTWKLLDLDVLRLQRKQRRLHIWKSRCQCWCSKSGRKDLAIGL